MVFNVPEHQFSSSSGTTWSCAHLSHMSQLRIRPRHKWFDPMMSHLAKPTTPRDQQLEVLIELGVIRIEDSAYTPNPQSSGHFSNRKPLALLFFCFGSIFKSLSSLNLSYRTFFDLPQIYFPTCLHFTGSSGRLVLWLVVSNMKKKVPLLYVREGPSMGFFQIWDPAWGPSRFEIPSPHSRISNLEGPHSETFSCT
jgi:hypothetical protein